MKRLLFVLIGFIVLCGCQSLSPSSVLPKNQHVIIDWVDFIKWDDIEYDGLYNIVIAGEEFIGKEIGEVQFNVDKNVHDPYYSIKNGDAAFHEVGTILYQVEGYPNLIAVKSEYTINGYEIYHARDGGQYPWNYKDMPLEKVEKVEIYKDQWPEYELVNLLEEQEEISDFISFLEEGEISRHFQPNMNNGDPTYYEMIFYIGEPIAYQFGLQYDGVTYYWHPWDTEILSEEIASFVQPME